MSDTHRPAKHAGSTARLLALLAICLLPFSPASRLRAQANPLLEQDIQALAKLNHGRAQVMKGIGRFRAGDLAAARRILVPCTAASPHAHEACFILAQVCYREDDYAAALDWMHKAETGYLQLREILQRVRQNLALIDMDKREELNDMALDLFKQSRRAQCTQEKLRQVSGQLDQQAKGIHGEQDDRQRIETAVPAEYAYVQGNILFRLKRLAEAESCYESAIRGDPRHIASYNNLINLCLIGRRPDDARAWLEQAEKYELELNRELVRAVDRAR